MTGFEWVAGALGGVISGIVLYLTKTVIEVPGKYVQKEDFHPEQFMLKTDCRRDSDRIYEANEKAHEEIFRKLDELKNMLINEARR